MWLLYLYVWMFRISVGLFNVFIHLVASGYVCTSIASVCKNKLLL